MKKAGRVNQLFSLKCIFGYTQTDRHTDLDAAIRMTTEVTQKKNFENKPNNVKVSMQ